MLTDLAKKCLRAIIRRLGPERVASLALELSNEEAGTARPTDLELRARLATAAWRRLMIEQFLEEKVGHEYGVSREQKRDLIQRFQTNTTKIPTGTSWLFHLILAQEILNLPRSVLGDVMECGCWKGASTSSLSLVCRMVGRRLIVCDSFEGLPEEPPGTLHLCPHSEIYGYYEPGMYAARLDEVRGHVEKYGDVSVCEFVPGFFCDSLPQRQDPLAFAFLDVDLLSSTQDCVKHIWPQLADGGFIYTDDSSDMEVVRLWFDESWWHQELGTRAPGYIGTGCGLPVDLKTSTLGYVRKLLSPEAHFQRVPWLRYEPVPVPRAGDLL